MNRPALIEAIRILKTIPPSRFDMGRFASFTTCGTIACIAGHCAMDPWFNTQGFTLRTAHPHIPAFAGHEGRRAIAKFFDLSHAQVAHVFYANRKQTPTTQTAIASIKRLLAQ